MYNGYYPNHNQGYPAYGHGAGGHYDLVYHSNNDFYGHHHHHHHGHF